MQKPFVASKARFKWRDASAREGARTAEPVSAARYGIWSGSA